jgi:hypothetical protein
VTECVVSINALREGSWNLIQGSIVQVKIRAQNQIDWGEYS